MQQQQKHWFSWAWLYCVLQMSTNLNLWNAAKGGKNDAVVEALATGADKNWNNDSHVSDNDK